MNKVKGFLLGTLLGVAMIAGAQSLYYGWNPATGQETIHGALIDGSSVQVITGCSLTALVGGTNAGQFTAGATTCIVTLADPVPSPHGFLCFLNDLTHSVVFHAVTTSKTGCQAVGVVTIGDTITYLMIGY